MERGKRGKEGIRRKKKGKGEKRKVKEGKRHYIQIKVYEVCLIIYLMDNLITFTRIMLYFNIFYE